MSFLSKLFGVYSDKKSQELSQVLRRLLPDDGAESSAAKAGRRRRGPEPGLPVLHATEWFKAAAGASAQGELVALRSELTQTSMVLLSLAGVPGERAFFAGVAAALAELAADGGWNSGFVATAEPASPAALVLLQGRASGGRFHTARGGTVLVYVEEDMAEAVEAAPASDPKRLAELSPSESASIAAASSLDVDRNPDFVLSYFFLPPTFPAAPVTADTPSVPEAAVFWDKLSDGSTAGAHSIWFAGSLGDPKTGLVVFFELPSEGIPDQREFTAHALTILRQGWGRAVSRMTRQTPALSTSRFAPIARAPEAHLRGAIRAAGELRLGMGGFALAVWLPTRFLAFLSGVLKPHIETPGGTGRPLDVLVAVNESLLEKWMPDHREVFLRPHSFAGSKRQASTPPLAALLQVLGRQDAALALQNCLLPHYGAQGLPYVFFFHRPYVRNGKRVRRPYPFAPFRDADVTRMLPDAAREEWWYERRGGLSRKPVTLDDCIAANEEAAKLLWDAARTGKLAFSLGSYDLLEEKVGKRLAATAKVQLEALTDKDIPFGFLATLEKRDANRIIERLSNRDLARASAGDRRHVELLHSAMGSGRRRDFDEELEIVELRMERGETTSEVAAAMKLELLDRMKGYAEELKRDRSSSVPAQRHPERR